MKIFRMDDCTWMAGATLEDCTAEWVEHYGGEIIEGEFAPYEETALDKLIFFDEDARGGIGKRRTFREELDRLIASGETFPLFFATTEC